MAATKTWPAEARFDRPPRRAEAPQASAIPTEVGGSRSFLCPLCGGGTGVSDSRPFANGIRRRRYCVQCGERLSTYEHVVGSDPRREQKILLRTIKELYGVIAQLEAEIAPDPEDGTAL
jgi:hypothetical protein